jgi:hypothetical protein
MLRVAVLLPFMGFCAMLTAGARNDDYEVCAGCEIQRLEVASPQQLDATICYETAMLCALKAKAIAHVEPILADVQTTLDFGGLDPRVEKIRLFFLRNNSPGAKYAKLFVQVADANHIDWRLLPTFAFIESGGGRVHRNNNIFGWDSGKARFKSIEESIRYVGRALTLGPYKGKTPAQKIRVYNIHKSYHLIADKYLKMLNDVEV